MMKKILVAYDGSAQAGNAFETGLDLAAQYGAELVVLSITRPPEPPEAVETEAVLEGAQEYYEKQFDVLRGKAAAKGVATTCEVRVGHPADQIIHAADELGADLIVLGHRGKSLVKRWLLGSISRRVVTYAGCSVLIVR